MNNIISLAHEAMQGKHQANCELNDIFEENNLIRLNEKNLDNLMYPNYFIVYWKNQEDHDLTLEVYEKELVLPLEFEGSGYFHKSKLWTKKKQRHKFTKSNFIQFSISLSDRFISAINQNKITSEEYANNFVPLDYFICYMKNLKNIVKGPMPPLEIHTLIRRTM